MSYLWHHVGSKAGETLFIFDLDSTLFNTKHRTQRIFEELSQEPAFSGKYPLLCAKIQLWKELGEIYDPIEFVSVHTGYKVQSTSVLAMEMRYYWRQRFFHGSYLRYDHPYEGAGAFLNKLYEAGCDISYLTARNRKILLGGTIMSLAQHKFPLPCPDTQPISLRPRVTLTLKPDGEVSDTDYKRLELKVLKGCYKKVVYIENEPSIVAMAQCQFPEIHSYLFHSVHSTELSFDELAPQIKASSFSKW